VFLLKNWVDEDMEARLDMTLMALVEATRENAEIARHGV